MHNVKRFIRHARKITKQGNVKFTTVYAESAYSLYPQRIHRKMISRSELLLAYDSVAEFFRGPDVIIQVDDIRLQAYFAEDDDRISWVDIETGEVMFTQDIDCITYSTDWARQLYHWGK